MFSGLQHIVPLASHGHQEWASIKYVWKALVLCRSIFVVVFGTKLLSEADNIRKL